MKSPMSLQFYDYLVIHVVCIEINKCIVTILLWCADINELKALASIL